MADPVDIAQPGHQPAPVPDPHSVNGHRADREAVTAALAAELADVVYALQVRPDTRFVYLSRSIEDLLGYAPEDFYSDPAIGRGIVQAEDRHHFRVDLRSSASDTREFTARFTSRDGRTVWTEHRARQVKYDDGQIVLYGAMRTISALRPAEAAVIDEQEEYRLTSVHSQDVVLRSDADNRVEYASPSVTTVLGWAPEALVGRAIPDIVHPDDVRAGYHAQQALLRGESQYAEGEARFITSTGEWRWMRVVGRVVMAPDGSLAGTVVDLRDIQAEMATRAELEREIDHDALTGLAKRGLTLGRVQAALDRPDREGLALMCASVDGLVLINEAYTHTAGDRVLTVVAERLIRAVGDITRLGRVAGSEFLIVVDDVFTPDDVAARAVELLAAARGPVLLGTHEIEVSISLGVARPDGGDAAELVRDATTAMRQASAKGHDRWEYLDAERANASRSRLAVQASLRQALNDDHIRPWFQPVVNLSDSSLAGFEALVRWEGADGEVLEPAQFFDAAERSYLVTTLDRVILRGALDALVDVEPHLALATNVSAPTLADAGFFAYVVDELERSGISPSRLNLEVTETSLVDVSAAVRSGMRDLAALGVTWWVDDFGTGYSSISHLRDLPVGGLKLDRSFTMGVASGDQRSIRVSQGLAGLARGLALRTVAEGVQGERDAAVLLGQGWSMAQGWYFGRATREMAWHPDPALLA
ncbi:MAG: putative bifunctional diguanylate cyclase/phosphodiesterase [Candidatus Nanopelagicales bacterium]